MEYALIAIAAFAIGFIVRGRLEKPSPPVTPKSGGGPGEENDQPGP